MGYGFAWVCRPHAHAFRLAEQRLRKLGRNDCLPASRCSTSKHVQMPKHSDKKSQKEKKTERQVAKSSQAGEHRCQGMDFCDKTLRRETHLLGSSHGTATPTLGRSRKARSRRLSIPYHTMMMIFGPEQWQTTLCDSFGEHMQASFGIPDDRADPSADPIRFPVCCSCFEFMAAHDQEVHDYLTDKSEEAGDHGNACRHACGPCPGCVLAWLTAAVPVLMTDVGQIDSSTSTRLKVVRPWWKQHHKQAGGNSGSADNQHKLCVVSFLVSIMFEISTNRPFSINYIRLQND